MSKLLSQNKGKDSNSLIVKNSLLKDYNLERRRTNDLVKNLPINIQNSTPDLKKTKAIVKGKGKESSNESNVSNVSNVSKGKSNTMVPIVSSAPFNANCNLSTGSNKDNSSNKVVKSRDSFSKSNTYDKNKFGNSNNNNNYNTVNPIHKRNNSLAQIKLAKEKDFTTPIKTPSDEKEKEINSNITNNTNIITTNTNYSPDQSVSDPILNCLQNSLVILNKIRVDFEQKSEENNNMNPEIELSNFISQLKERNSRHSDQLSDFDKLKISKQISDNSEKRIDNYRNLFLVISNSICDVKDCLLTLREKEKETPVASPIPTIPFVALNLSSTPNTTTNSYRDRTRQSSHRYSMNETGLERIKNTLDMCLSANQIEESLNENDNDRDNVLHLSYDCKDLEMEDYSCDFSEDNMLENVQVSPPKLTNVNRMNILSIKQLRRLQSKQCSSLNSKKVFSVVKRMSSKKKKSEDGDKQLQRRRTLIEFDALRIDATENAFKENATIETKQVNEFALETPTENTNNSTNVATSPSKVKESKCLLY